MPKRKPREVTGFERELVELIDKVSPGGITLSRSRTVLDGKAGLALSFVTRSTTCEYWIDDLAEGVMVAKEDLDSEENDPIRPMWHRLNRFQREAVTRTLDAMASKHMARAAKAKLGVKGGAHGEYALSDAFSAALVMLRSADDYDQRGDLLPNTPKLDEGPPEPILIAKPRKRASPSPAES